MENNQNVEMNLAEPATYAGSRRRQKLLLAAVLLICAAILGTGTLAYFTAEETAHNVITTGKLALELVEEDGNGDPWPEDGVDDVMPGTSVDKVPYMVNHGGVDFYARMSVSIQVTNEKGEPLSAEYISLDINRSEWTEKDGYYYYHSAVKPGEETKPLFTKVTFAEDMPNAYMNSKVEIDVHAEAVQSRNNGSSALTADGWGKAMEGEAK